MELSNYTLRNTCFRLKKGLKPKDPELAKLIENVKGNYSWSSFADKWDIILKNGKPIVYESIKDINLVSDVCAKKSMITEMGIEKEWSTEEQAIINMIESQFLDGKMDWENYKKSWRIRWDDDHNKVATELLRTAYIQKEVTQEMIDQKLQEQMAASKKMRENIVINLGSSDKPE